MNLSSKGPKEALINPHLHHPDVDEEVLPRPDGGYPGLYRPGMEFEEICKFKIRRRMDDLPDNRP